MAPRSPTRSYSRSYSKSPVKTKHRKSYCCHSRDHYYSSHSRSHSHSRSRRPPSPPPLPRRRSGSRCSKSRTRSRSVSSSSHRRRNSSRSRTPNLPRRGTRDRPLASRCIGVFGLNVNTSQNQIRDLFIKFGPIERIQMVIDAQTGRSRGFCFIYYVDMADAKVAKGACSGMEVDGRRIRVDYSITQRPHTPTPGVYMGRPTRHYCREHNYSSRHSRRHTPSPTQRRDSNYKEKRRNRYENSRTRSRSSHRSSRY